MSNNAQITARQLWGSYNTGTDTSVASQTWCTPLILPTGGIIVFNDNFTTTISGAKATFKLPCDSNQQILSPDTTGNSTVIGVPDPFYASIAPQIFALATATVISYVLVILIFITPRTFYVGGPGGGAGFLSRSGLTGSSSIVGVGRRPLLQKIATVTVAISLTIAASDTFDVASSQYEEGYLDSSGLVTDVVNSLEIRIIRVISDTFLWLAQVQTLIRLFPRHKEKVTIKWLGFAMVSCDTIFSILDSFVSQNDGTKPRSFQDAIPALNYLFELAISLIYASCVVYYSLSKRRFAFWHPKMRNVCLVALVSYMAILIPVVFFVLDVSLPDVAGWGEYIRWVGAAAASVVVWEWVERIEALERDERKDGILGREIFDGDEMLDLTLSDDADWSGRGGTADGDIEKGPTLTFTQGIKKIRNKLPIRRRRRRPAADDTNTSGTTAVVSGANGEAAAPTPPSNALTPPSRSDTTSAASTVYAIHYHNLASPSPAIPKAPAEATAQPAEPTLPKPSSDSSADLPTAEKEAIAKVPADSSTPRHLWNSVANPFKRRRAEPPAEVAGAQLASGMRRSPIGRAVNLKDRLGAWGVAQRDRFGRNASMTASELPVMVIPAPRADQGTWSPAEVRGSTSTADTRTRQNIDGQRNRRGGGAIVAAPQDQGVIVIPAPINGRSWSPQGVEQADTPTPMPERNPNSTGSERQATTTPRGTLTIEESPRASGAMTRRRSTAYTRPVSINPIAESMGMSMSPAGRRRTSHERPSLTDRATASPIPPAARARSPPPLAPSAPTQDDIEAAKSPTAMDVDPSSQPPKDVQASEREREREKAEDSRDTGGTIASS